MTDEGLVVTLEKSFKGTISLEQTHELMAGLERAIHSLAARGHPGSRQSRDSNRKRAG